MSDYILKYSRGEEVKYISHLDFVRMLQRTIRRAGLEPEYSKGFNPHPLISVACPLSVGVTADGEFIKISFAEDYSCEHIIQSLNEAFPKGFRIVAARMLTAKEIDLSNIDRARYLADIELGEPVDFNVDEFMANEQLIVPKKTKSGTRDTDIRPLIHHISLKENVGRHMLLTMVIATGSSANLKPETAIAAIEKYTEGFRAEFVRYRRLSLLAGRKEYLKNR